MTRNEKAQEFIRDTFFLQLEQEQLERIYQDTKKLRFWYNKDL